MPPRTSLFSQLPWVGGVNTSLDESMIPPNQLTKADNVQFDTRGSKKKREGIKYNWDNVAASNESIYGLHEFWFGTDTKLRRFVSVNTAREIKRYLPSGSSLVINQTGRPWEGVTDQISMLTFNNRLVLAVNENDNLVKVWDGDDTNPAEDLKNLYGQMILGSGRASSGTTRTLVLNSTFKGLVGDFIVVSNAAGANAAFYNGTYEVTSLATTNVTNDTITYEGAASLNESATTDATLTVDGTAPQASILRDHLGRIWTNDKLNKDRIHYSSPFNHLEWLGFGDSGALDIGVGDGDPEGIVAIFPTFKGDLFVAKKTKLYRIKGYSAETFSIELVSSGIGCVSHNAVALVDQDDLFFISEKGIHSMNAVNSFGDFSSKFASADIQKTFISSFPKSRLKYAKAAYNPEINSVAFAFSDGNLSDRNRTTLNINNSIWLYNVSIGNGAWYRWPDIPCQALIVANDPDKKRFYIGTDTNRIIKGMTKRAYDQDYDGEKFEIKMVVHTGQILIDNQLYTLKGMKRFHLQYKPFSQHEIRVNVRVDNKPLASANQIVFNEDLMGDLLGETFVLGESALGSEQKLGNYTRMIDGYGKSFKVELEFGGVNKKAEIQGFSLEFEPAGTKPEVN